jgi:hypothetical protein
MMSQTISSVQAVVDDLLASTTDARDRIEEGRKPVERAD